MSKVKYHEKSLGLFYHILVHVGVTSIALFLATNEWNLVVTCAMIFIICTHYAIDIWKTYQTFITRYYIIDQAGHLSMIVIVSWLLNSYYPELLTQSHVLLENPLISTQTVLLWALAVCFVFNPTGISFMVFFKPLTEKHDIGIKENDSDVFNNFNEGALTRFLLLVMFGLGFGYLIFILIAGHYKKYVDMLSTSKNMSNEAFATKIQFHKLYLIANYFVGISLGWLLNAMT